MVVLLSFPLVLLALFLLSWLLLLLLPLLLMFVNKNTRSDAAAAYLLYPPRPLPGVTIRASVCNEPCTANAGRVRSNPI